MPLASFQYEIVDHLERALSLSSWIILRSRMGYGKREVVRYMAESLGLKLNSISLAGTAVNISRELLGSDDSDWPGKRNPGLLEEENSLLLLTDIEAADSEVVELLVRLAKVNRILGGGRNPYSPIIIMTVKDLLSPYQLSAIQPLIKYVPFVNFPESISQAEINEVIDSMLLEMGTVNLLGDTDLSFLSLPPDGFHSIRRWVIESIAEDGYCTAESLQKAVARSMSLYLIQLTYRGRPVSLADYSRWVGQLGPRCRAVADHLLRRMVEESYLINESVFHDMLTNLVSKCGIPSGCSGVIFCEWQKFFKSSSYFTREIKKRGAWGKRAAIIDLSDRPSTWRCLQGSKRKWVILADDFVGTGNSVSSVLPMIRRILELYPNVSMRAIFLAGFVDGVQALMSLEYEFGDERFRLSIGRLLSGADTCFHPDSRILQSQQDREILDEESNRLKDLGFGGNPRGYGGLGALVVLPSNVPNSTLPLLWFDQSIDWFPLFPVSMSRRASQ